MRRLALAGLVLTLTGCDALRDAFTPHARVAARAAGQALTAERLAELVAPVGRIPLDANTLASVAGVWVDYTLFATAVAGGDSLNDSALVLEASWPLASQMRWELFRERLLARRAALGHAQVDSAYETGGARLFQHILIQVPSGAARAVEAEKQRQLEDIRRQARTGADFARLARRFSEDQGSRGQGGMLAVAERGQFVQGFEDAAWELAPGGISGVVRSPYGFHIIRRPPLAEVRDSFRSGLESRLEFRLDSLYLDSLTVRQRIKVRDEAPAIARQATENLEIAREDDRPLVTFRGGRFRVRELIRWLYALDPQFARAFRDGTDEQITQFLTVVTQRQILLAQADSAGVTLAQGQWHQLRLEHDTTVSVLRRVAGLSPQALSDSAADAEGQLRLAAARVNEYLERVLRGQAQFLPVPPFFGSALRARGGATISQAGIARALERAVAMRGAADSLAGPAATEGPLRPTPGPAPIPGAADTPRR